MGVRYARTIKHLYPSPRRFNYRYKLSMTLEQQLSSLEPSKRLKELGVPQESHFYWAQPRQTAFPEPRILTGQQIYEYNQAFSDSPAFQIDESCSAFTVAELELLLPDSVNIAYKNGKKRNDNHWRSMKRVPHGYCVAYRHSSYSSDSWIDERGKTFADALAKMLVYLLENKLI